MELDDDTPISVAVKNGKKYSAIEIGPTGRRVQVTRPQRVDGREAGNSPMAVYGDKRSELDINESGGRGETRG